MKDSLLEIGDYPLSYGFSPLFYSDGLLALFYYSTGREFLGSAS
jgi:hypothetical protein